MKFCNKSVSYNAKTVQQFCGIRFRLNEFCISASHLPFLTQPDRYTVKNAFLQHFAETAAQYESIVLPWIRTLPDSHYRWRLRLLKQHFVTDFPFKNWICCAYSFYVFAALVNTLLMSIKSVICRFNHWHLSEMLWATGGFTTFWTAKPRLIE
jgi:hypothetical protein